jgi:hypothetical protein
MPHGWLSSRGRVLAGAGIGILTWVIPAALVDEAVDDGLAWEMRLRAVPTRLGVYFILGLCLFSGDPYTEVMRKLVQGLEKPLNAAGWQAPVSKALTEARRRAGEKPLKALFWKLAGAVSPGTAPWSHLGGLLVTALDGTAATVADSTENAAWFGRANSGKRKKDKDAAEPGDGRASVYPQARLVTLVACGTRAVIAAAPGPLRGKGTGERALAGQLLGSLQAGMLVLADRGFYSWQLWADAAAGGAHLLWRVSAPGESNCLRLGVLQELPDGSWLTRVWQKPARPDRTDRGDCRTVRVIEFTITVTGDDGAPRTERYRLLTTLLDHRAFPAPVLAACYAWRWSIELAFREIKTVLRGARRVLRGRSPGLALQEIWAYLAVYQALRILIARAAARRGLDPSRISFSAALNAAARSIKDARSDMTAALDAAETEILAPAALIPERHGRVYARAVKRSAVTYPPARRTRPVSQHATYTITVTAPGTTTRQPSRQGEQATQQPNNSP